MVCKNCRKFNPTENNAEIMLSAGGGSPSSVNGSGTITTKTFGTANFLTSAFDASTIEYMEWTVWMPSTWDLQNLFFEVAWTAESGTGDVVWALEIASYENDDSLTNNWGAATEVVDTLIAANDLHITEKSDEVLIGGGASNNSLVQFRIHRVATSVEDTLNADALFLAAKVFYRII